MYTLVATLAKLVFCLQAIECCMLYVSSIAINLFAFTMHAHTCTHTHTHTHHRMAGVSTVPSLDGAVAKELNSEADLVSRVQRLRCKA